MKSILLCLQNNINVLRMVSKALNLIEATENEDCVVATVSKTFYEAYSKLNTKEFLPARESQERIRQAAEMLEYGVDLVYCAFVDH